MLQNFITSSLYILYPILGVFTWLIAILHLVILSPILVYRYVLANYITPFGSTTNLLSPIGQFFSSELSSSDKSRGTRCAIVAKMFFPGTLSPADMREEVLSKWIYRKNADRQLKYPEFHQYFTQWMGYMVWRKDEHFSIDNHFFEHSIPGPFVDKSESILDNLTETLVNKRFTPKRSPWEAHVVTNYQTFGEVSTVVVFRIHHGMADGYSLLFAFIEGILGQDLRSMEVAKPKEKKLSKDIGVTTWKRLIYPAWRLFYDTGYLSKLQYLSVNKTPWYLPDEQKNWQQFYGRSKEIPVERIKLIKDHTGVSFTSVLLSCFSAAATKDFKKKKFTDLKVFSVAIPIPLPNHPGKLENHMTGAFMELPCDQSLQSLERLQLVEQMFQDARHNSQFPFILWMVMNVVGYAPAFITRHFSTNKVAAAGLTNFPGPGIPVPYNDSICHGVEFCVGGMPGVCGLTLSLLSYNGSVRFSVNVESAVMTKSDLRMFVHNLEEEIDVLLNLCSKDDFRK